MNAPLCLQGEGVTPGTRLQQQKLVNVRNVARSTERSMGNMGNIWYCRARPCPQLSLLGPSCGGNSGCLTVA